MYEDPPCENTSFAFLSLAQLLKLGLRCRALNRATTLEICESAFGSGRRELFIKINRENNRGFHSNVGDDR